MNLRKIDTVQSMFFIACILGLVGMSWMAMGNAQESGPVVLKLIAERKFTEAEQWIDSQLLQHPDSADLVALQVKLGIAIAQAERNTNRGAQLIKGKLPMLIESPKFSSLHALVAAQGLDELLRIEQLTGEVSARDELLRKLRLRLRSESPNEPSPAYEIVLRTTIERLAWLDQFDEAKTVLMEERHALDAGDFSSAIYRSRLASQAMIASQSMIRVFPEFVDQLIEETSHSLETAEPSSSEFATFLRFQRATILAKAMHFLTKAQPQWTRMMSAAERYQVNLTEEQKDNFKRMAVLLTRAIQKSEQVERVNGAKDNEVRFAKIVDCRMNADQGAVTEVSAIAKGRYVVVFFWSANSDENLRQLRLLHRWYQNCDPTEVLLVAATRLSNYQWSETLQLGVAAKAGSVPQVDEIKMLESIQVKFHLCFPLAIVESPAQHIQRTGLLVLAPNGKVVDVLQMDPQSLRTISMLVGK